MKATTTHNVLQLLDDAINLAIFFTNIYLYKFLDKIKINIMEKSILLHCISPDELKQIIKEVIREELIAVRKQLEEKDSEILLSRQETIDFLKIDSSTLWSWTKKGKIACYGIGNRRYYKKENLLNSLVLLKVKRA